MIDVTNSTNTDTIHTASWTKIRIKDHWLHINHVFVFRNPLSNEVKEYLDKHNTGKYAIVYDEGWRIAFQVDKDITMFLLRFS